MPTGADLIAAIKGGDAERACAILAEDASLANAKSEKGDSVLFLSAIYNQPDITQALVAAGAQAGLVDACAAGMVDKVRELLGANPAAVNAPFPSGFAPIHLAAYFGQAKVVKALITMGADLEGACPRNLSPLQAACAGGRGEVVNLFMATGVDVQSRKSPNKSTPLHIAARLGNAALVRLLLDSHADPKATDGEGKTPKDLAAAGGHAGVAGLLQ